MISISNANACIIKMFMHYFVGGSVGKGISRKLISGIIAVENLIFQL